MINLADEETQRATNAMLSLMKPSTELVPGSHAHTLINGLGVAHFDAHLNDHGGAADISQVSSRSSSPEARGKRES